MSQTPACPGVPDDVRALARSIATSAADRQFSSQWYALRRAATDAILADRASRALPSTALAARPEEGWQIKPLEWVKHPTADMWRAETILGFYEVSTIRDALWQFKGHADYEDAKSADDRLSAMSAAQAHHEARIRSAFVAPSTPPTAGDGHD